ncbi:ribonuclease T2-like [Puccinia graminis f. sp. tritici]|uniref:Ribonuclease T2-like n=1 Tax=Puccinia graminis f. sp. tritici TaxID=56615 RepID=A0A5B0SAH9_PUCGR|nr:ribonuclease T2-like [Puccinia graminis f. sp. tritici]
MVSSAILLLPAILIAINTHSFFVNTQQLIFTNSNQLNTQDYTCPANPPTSCHLSSGDGKEPVNSCCTNTPGGQILLTQVCSLILIMPT